MSIAMMIDIETLSLRPNAYVTQVGFCVANLDMGQCLKEPVGWLMNDDQPNSHKDINTIRWWLNQSDEVAALVFGSEDSLRIDASTLFYTIEAAIATIGVTEVWASPAMFDLPILTNLWGGKKPWSYDQERCMMTLRKRIDPEGVLAPPPNTRHHDAAADAEWQMHYLIALHQYLRDHAVRAVPALV